MGKKLIELKNVSKSYDDELVVDDFNLYVNENEFVTLLGPSGCGKTTLLRMIGGFEELDAGEIILNGERVNNLPAYERPINTVFQRYALFPHLNVYDNVAFGLRNYNRQYEELKSSVRKSYEKERKKLQKELSRKDLSKAEKQEIKARLKEIRSEIKEKTADKKETLVAAKLAEIEKRYTKLIAQVEAQIEAEETPDKEEEAEAAQAALDKLLDEVYTAAGKNKVKRKKLLAQNQAQIKALEAVADRQTLKALERRLKDLKAQQAEEERKAPSLMMSRHHIDQAVTEVLALVGLAGFEERRIDNLSGGQMQRVAIARAVVNKPKILLLDEPLAALDLKLRQNMQYELKEMQRELGITFIYVTHDQEEALTMSDTIVVMDKGKIQQIGTPEDIYNEPKNRFVANFIGESNIFPGTYLGDRRVAFLDNEFECVDTAFAPGEAVDVVIRPEDFDIVPLAEAKIQATVDISTFKGVFFEICVLREGKEIIIHKYENPAPGETIGLAVDPYEIHLMKVAGDETL